MISLAISLPYLSTILRLSSFVPTTPQTRTASYPTIPRRQSHHQSSATTPQALASYTSIVARPSLYLENKHSCCPRRNTQHLSSSRCEETKLSGSPYQSSKSAGHYANRDSTYTHPP